MNDFGQKLGIAYGGGGFFEYLRSILDQMMTDDGIIILSDLLGIVHHHVTLPGQLMYIPIASAVWERTLGDQYVIGFRTGHLSGDEGSKASMNALVEQHRAACSDPDTLCHADPNQAGAPPSFLLVRGVGQSASHWGRRIDVFKCLYIGRRIA